MSQEKSDRPLSTFPPEPAELQVVELPATLPPTVQDLEADWLDSYLEMLERPERETGRSRGSGLIKALAIGEAYAKRSKP